MGHFFSKVSLFIDKKEAAAHLILDQDFATAPFIFKALVCTGDLINPLFIGFFSKDLTKSDHFMR